MQEEWRSVEGYEGYYEVSNAGRVRSMDRMVPSGSNSIHLTGRLRALNKNSRGYVFVTLRKNQLAKTFFVHRLVANAFIKNPWGYPHVAHLDGNPNNNCAPNLQWATSRINNRQKGNYVSSISVVPAAVNSATLTQETWRVVAGYEGLYEVSDLGTVRSLDHYVKHLRGGSRLCSGIIRKTFPNQGYLKVHLSKHNHTQMCSVHQLVANAFLGPCPAEMQVAHWDNNGLNPRLDNLRYATPAGNNNDKHRHGTQFQGEAVLTHKLTDDDVREIRIALATGISKMSQARKFGVSHKTIRNLAAGLIWKSVI